MSKALNLKSIEDMPFKTLGALYFLDGGHYLFRQPQENNRKRSKFVTAADVAAAFTQQEIDSGWMPAGVVRYGRAAAGEYFVYSAPEQMCLVTLDVEQPAIKIPIPRTLLVGWRYTFYLFALVEQHFGEQAEVFTAPFPNVYAHGAICWGSNKPGEVKAVHARQVWELFFSTPFTAHLSTDRCIDYRRDVRELLRSLVGKRRFPLDQMISTGHEVRRVVTNILEGGGN